MPAAPPHPAHHWAETWQRAWEARDVEAVVQLYDPDVLFWSHPFREVARGREGVRRYVAQAFAEEEEVRAWFRRPLLDGDRAAVTWWATMREGGEAVTLAGTSCLHFGADGLVRSQRDTWNQVSGRLDPPEGWAG